MIIMINSENKKRGKAWKYENYKDSFSKPSVIVDSRMVFLFQYV